MIKSKVRHRTGLYDGQGQSYFYKFIENHGEDKNLVPAMAIIERPDGMVEYWDAEYVVFIGSEEKYKKELHETTSASA